MRQLRFRTNFHCDGCVTTVSSYLRAVSGIVHWEVDLENPEKMLTVYGDEAREIEIMEKVREAGYQISQIADSEKS